MRIRNLPLRSVGGISGVMSHRDGLSHPHTYAFIIIIKWFVLSHGVSYSTGWLKAHCTDQAGLELEICLLSFPECSD